MASNFYFILILIAYTRNSFVQSKRLPTKAVGRLNPCPEICRIKEDNPHCREVSARNLKQHLTNITVSEICERYLTREFAHVKDCVVRCEQCAPRVIHARCSMSLKKINKIYARCKLPSETGYCRGYFMAWYYDYKQGDCKNFVYGGCGGNDNRFDTQLQCYGICGLLGILFPHPDATALSLSPTHQEL